MFLSKSVSLISKTAVIRTTLPRVMGVRSFSIDDTFGKKVRLTTVWNRTRLVRAWPFAVLIASCYYFNSFQEKVEEDLYMRELEKKFIEKKKAEMVAKMAEYEESEFKAKIAPMMAEAEVLLGKSGDSISHDGLEALARWKLDL